MKYRLLLFVLFISATTVKAQDIQEIATGAGYQQQSFVQLATGTEKLSPNTAWDIAFTVFGVQDAGIFINESSGSSMGQPLPQTEVYWAITDNFSETPDPAALIDYRLYNSEKSWAYGAFNEYRDTLNPFDFGWGVYNPQTNSVEGNSVFVVKLRSGAYKKLKIESLNGTTYTFRYANLNGSNEVTKTINKGDHAGKTLAYFNLETGVTADVEPASGGFDMTYCRFMTWLLDPGTGEYIPYAVTGILSGPGVTVAEADGVDPQTVQYQDYQNNQQAQLDAIGHDWKAFSGTAWSLDEDRVFFLKTAESRVWKLYFIDFEGSSTGKSVFEKTDLGIISAVQDPAALGMKALIYPNPVADRAALALEIPEALTGKAQIQIVDMSGRILYGIEKNLVAGFQVFDIEASVLPAGLYSAQMIVNGHAIQIGSLVKQ